MNPTHTPEPWNPGFCTDDGFNICANDNGRVIATAKHIDDRNRIVACVNACAGLQTEDLEAGVLREGVGAFIAERDHYKEESATLRAALQTQAEEAAKLMAQRDGLLEAAQAVVDRWDSPSWKDVPHTGEFIHKLRVAVTNATTINERD
jgi:hypothetical protein